MTAAKRELARLLGVARRRRFLIDVAISASLALAVSVVVLRLHGLVSAVWAAALGLVAVGCWAALFARRLDAIWLTRGLDRLRTDMEDSAELLLHGDCATSRLVPLQRVHLAERLLSIPTPDLREPWPLRRIGLAWVLTSAWSLAWLLWPSSEPEFVPVRQQATQSTAQAQAHTRIVAAQLHLVPPKYTGLPVSDQPGLEAKVPQGSVLHWRLQLQPTPESAQLKFHDGSAVTLQREGELWSGQREIDTGLLYRLDIGNAASLHDDPLYRLDVIADQAPQIRVSEPETSLTLLNQGQTGWDLAFEANDDYGLQPARIQITLAQGSGENIRFTEQHLQLRGSGNATRQSFRYRLDLNALGFATGDDLIVRLSLADNRKPVANVTRHPSFILRWPPAASEQAAGLEGMVQHTLPAYFRSQRQIIIDSEALLAERAQLPNQRFLDRSDQIGMDQRILRMRYGQFLGDETEGPEAPDGEHEHGGDASRGASQSSEFSVLAEFGHTHDQPEAATLFDPRTRALLKAALDAMWQSEGLLRQGQPKLALPHEYEALGYIKQVQQASRIYLSRVGLELPPIDFGRRLSGERSGLRNRSDPIRTAVHADQPVMDAWHYASEALERGSDSEALPRLADWTDAQGDKLPDRLALLATIDALQRDPTCKPCAGELRRLLWPLLPIPAANARWRQVPSASGHAYLDALDPPPAAPATEDRQ